MFKGLSANLYAQIVTLWIQIGVVPILIYCWGLNDYGKWIFVSGFQAFFVFLDFGFMVSTLNEAGLYAKRKKANYVNIIIASAFTYTIVCTVTFGIMGSLVAAFVYNLTHTPNEIIYSILILLLYSLISQVNTIIDSIFRINDSYSRGLVLLETVRLVEWSVALLVAWLGGGILMFSVALLFARAILIYLVLIYVNSAVFKIKFYFSNCYLKLFFKLKLSSYSWFAFRLGDAISIQGVSLVVAYFFGYGWLTIYATHRTLARLIFQFSSMITNTAWPQMTSLWATDGEKWKEYVKLTLLRIFLTVGFLSIALCVTFDYIYKLWLHGEAHPNVELFLYLVLSASIFSISYVLKIAFVSKGKAVKLGNYYLISVLLMIFVLTIFPELGLVKLSFIIVCIEFSYLFFSYKMFRHDMVATRAST